MEDREIRAVSRVSPPLKAAVARPAAGRRELTYRLGLFERNIKPKPLDPDGRKRNLVRFIAESEMKKEHDAEMQEKRDMIDDHQAGDFMTDLKRRIYFDRAVIIGDFMITAEHSG